MTKDRDDLLALLREARKYVDANLPTNIYAVRREGLRLLDRIDAALAAPAESEGADWNKYSVLATQASDGYDPEEMVPVRTLKKLFASPPTPAVERQGWMPIESAPEGEVVLLSDKNGNRWTDIAPGDEAFSCGPATHWMPLPEPPGEVKEKPKG